MGVGDDRRALGHAVADRVGEVYVPEEFLYLLVEGCPAHDDLYEVAAEGVHEFSADLFLDHLVDDRHLEQGPDSTFLHNLLDLGLVDFLDDERHGYDYVRFDFGQCLHDDLRTRNPGKEVDVRSDCHLKEELEHHSVHVG